MSDTQAQATPPVRAAGWKWARRLLGVLALWLVLHTVTRPSPSLNDPAAPPSGFVDGLRHGALMPLALPRLLIGRDATIYAASNTGRTYKLGYTAGVNGCGALFFGLMFRRVSRLRRRPEPIP